MSKIFFEEKNNISVLRNIWNVIQMMKAKGQNNTSFHIELGKKYTQIYRTFANWKYQCTIKLIYYGHNDSRYNLTWILILNDIVTTSICTLSILAYKHTIKITMNLVARWKYWSMKHCLTQTDSQPDLFSMFSELNLFRLERFCF